jgi:hypothetical protein
MTPKEKAFYLMDKFIRFQRNGIYNVVHEDIAKQYALIAVDEIMEVCPYISKEYCDTVEQIRAYDIQFVSYWEEVKQEILNL